jgi:membrane protease YdiL (CAAX protease family)
MNMEAKTSDTKNNSLLNRIPVIIRAVVIGLVVVIIGIAIWTVDFTIIPAPWSLIIMIFVLWAYFKYFSGSWAPRQTVEFRRKNFRNIRLSFNVWKIGLIAAILFVVVFQSSFMVTFRLIPFPELAFKSQYRILDSLPPWIGWLTVGVSSLVAGICEETGFRGYMQVPIEKRYGPLLGITITSIFFFLLHIDKTWAPLIILHIFFASALLGILAYYSDSLIPGIIGHTIMDIFNFSYWWSNLAGNYGRKTVFVTGIDIHFVLWCSIFLIAISLFFIAIINLRKIKIVTIDG